MVLIINAGTTVDVYQFLPFQELQVFTTWLHGSPILYGTQPTGNQGAIGTGQLLWRSKGSQGQFQKWIQKGTICRWWWISVPERWGCQECYRQDSQGIVNPGNLRPLHLKIPSILRLTVTWPCSYTLYLQYKQPYILRPHSG